MKSVLFGGLRVAGSMVLIVCLSAAPGRLEVARAAPASAPVIFNVNTAFDAVADFNGEPGFDTCRTNQFNTTCSLWAAIMNANRHSGSVIINLPAGTYPLDLPTGSDDDSSGNLNITGTVTLVGAGAASSIVDGGDTDNVFRIAAIGVVTMTGLTIRNGRGSTGGGGIVNYGHLILADSVISGNRGITAAGGLYNLNTGVATLSRVTLEANHTSADGGAIYNNGTLSLNDSTVDGNTANNGAGLVNFPGGTLTIFDSTISNNSARGSGGGLANFSAARLFHTTIAGNLADNTAGGGPNGGGIFNGTGHVVQLWNTLLAGNYVSHTANDCGGVSLTSQDYNSIDDDLGGCPMSGTKTHNITTTVPVLGPLADNGGATRTRALLIGSPAIDQIPSNVCQDQFGTAPVPDQRGVVRPVGPLCDIGAFEGAQPAVFFGHNLVRNGDAEAGAGSPTGAWVGAPSWFLVPGQHGQFTVVTYNAAGEFPAVPTDTVPANHGANFFAGGMASVSSASQGIDFSPISRTVDAGRVTFILSADLGGYQDLDDNVFVKVTFYNDSSPAPVGGIVTLNQVLAVNRGNQTKFIHASVTGLVPATARFIDLYLEADQGENNLGTHNHGFADNVSFVLLPPPMFLPLVRR